MVSPVRYVFGGLYVVSVTKGKQLVFKKINIFVELEVMRGNNTANECFIPRKTANRAKVDVGNQVFWLYVLAGLGTAK